jgi:hypothetical protein
MNSIPARILAAAACATVANTCLVNARSYSLDSLGCLFQLSRAARPIDEEIVVRFSVSPLAERLSVRIPLLFSPAVISEHQVEAPEAEPLVPSQFTASFIQAPREVETEESVEHWPLFNTLRRWQSHPEVPGLSRSLGNAQSYLALDYSDIFETGRAAYKGGHGVSLLFRHNFRN